MERLAVVTGLRTPFCKMGTALKSMPAQDLGCHVVRELMERSGIEGNSIDEVIFGCVAQPPDAANIARVITLLAGLPVTVPAYTVHRNCASGFESVVSAWLKLAAHEADCILAGGTESMSQIPLYFQPEMKNILTDWGRAKNWGQRWQALSRFRLKYCSPRIGLQMGLTDPVCGLNMGQTAEVLAREFGISRQEQDEFALESHQRAVAARQKLREEIAPVLPPPEYKHAVEDDIGPRDNQTMEAVAKLRPVFDRRAGTVTAGNASQVTDGAAVVLLMRESTARERGLDALGYIRAFAYAGVEPQRMGIGPAHAIPRVLKKCGLSFQDIDVFEINEAFAVQVLACLRLLSSSEFAQEFGYSGFTGEIPRDRLNVNGGAIALGHPVGTTGTRLILTQLKHLQRTGLSRGIVSLCVGGGQGGALVCERT